MRLVVATAPTQRGRAEREESIVDPRTNLVDLGLQAIEVLMEPFVLDLIHLREGEVGAELSEQLL